MDKKPARRIVLATFCPSSIEPQWRETYTAEFHTVYVLDRAYKISWVRICIAHGGKLYGIVKLYEATSGERSLHSSWFISQSIAAAACAAAMQSHIK